MYCAECGYNNPVTAKICKNCELVLDTGIQKHRLADQPPTLIFASFRLRFFAWLLDLLLLASLVILLVIVILALVALTGDDSILENPMSAPFLPGAIVFMYFAYKVLMEAGAQGGTLGKQWMNIRVEDTRGTPLTRPQSLWRQVVRLFSYLMLGIGFLLQPFTPRKQALHDLLSASVVVQTNASKKISIMAIAVVLFVALMLPVLAVFSTVGLPLFQQYIQNVQMDKGIKIGRQATAAVSRFYHNNGHLPPSLPASSGYIGSSRHVAGVELNPQNGELTLIFAASARKAIRGKHLVFAPALAADNNIIWKCRSNDIEMRYLPDTCL